MKNYRKVSKWTLTLLSMMVIAGFLSPLTAGASGATNPHTEIVLDTVTLNTGVTLQYAERGNGKGKVIIFLHGYTDSWFSFSTVMANLPPQYHAYALTHRGHGDSEKPLAGYLMQDFAGDVIALMDHFGIHRAYVVGHSMGSVIAQRVAIDFPDRVKKLVLIGSVADVTTNEVVLGLKEYVDTLEDPIDPAFVLDFQASTLYNPIPEAFLETVVNESLKVPARVWQAALAGMVVDHTAELQFITAPTLLIWGDKDDIFLYSDQLMLDEGIADSTLLIYSDTGHGVHWEFPQRFTADLVDFLH
jgi:pimeloyl-ACP methyl ester carboxylesterase